MLEDARVLWSFDEFISSCKRLKRAIVEEQMWDYKNKEFFVVMLILIIIISAFSVCLLLCAFVIAHIIKKIGLKHELINKHKLSSVIW